MMVALALNPKRRLAKSVPVNYNPQSYAGVAQLFRARPCQGRGQGLESPHPHQERNLHF
jgi:hypothetical protein